MTRLKRCVPGFEGAFCLASVRRRASFKKTTLEQFAAFLAQLDIVLI